MKTKVIKKEKIFDVAFHFIMKKLHHVKLMMMGILLLFGCGAKGDIFTIYQNYLIILS